MTFCEPLLPRNSSIYTNVSHEIQHDAATVTYDFDLQHLPVNSISGVAPPHGPIKPCIGGFEDVFGHHTVNENPVVTFFQPQDRSPFSPFPYVVTTCCPQVSVWELSIWPFMFPLLNPSECARPDCLNGSVTNCDVVVEIQDSVIAATVLTFLGTI